MRAVLTPGFPFDSEIFTLAQMSPAAMAAAKLATQYADRAFARPAAPNALQIGPPDVALQFPAQETLQRAFNLATVSEGLVIEAAFTLALAHDPHFVVIGKSRVVVTEADRALALRNARHGLAGVEPPAATDAVGSAEIDCIAVALRTATLLLCDIKRAVSPLDRDLARFLEATLGAHRAARREGVRFSQLRALRVRWFAPTIGSPPNRVGRDAIDDVLGACVRDVVDHAVSIFRARYAERLTTLLTEKFDPPGVPIVAQPSVASVQPFDLAALRRAFVQKVRMQRSA